MTNSHADRKSRLRLPVDLRSVLSAGAGRLIALPIAALFAFLTTRVLIEEAGLAQYALISLIISVSMMLPFGDFGLGAAVVNITSVSRKPSEDAHLHQILLTSFRVLISVAIVFLTGDIVLTKATMWPSILGQAADGTTLNMAAGLAMGLFCVSIPLSLGQRLLLGMQRMGTATLLQAIGSPVAFALTLTAVTMRFGLTGLALGAPLGLLISSAAQFFVAHRVSGISLTILIPRLPKLRRYPGVSVRSVAGPMLIVTIALPVALQTDRLILSHVAPIQSVASYSLGLQIYTAAWSIIATSGLALWPIFARVRDVAAGAGSLSLKSSIVLFASVGVISGTAMATLGPTLGRLAGGDKVIVSTGLAISFGALLFAQSLQLPVGMYMTSEAGLKMQAVCVCFAAVLSVGASLIFATWWGAPGPVIGSVLAVLAGQFLPGAIWSNRRVSRVGSGERFALHCGWRKVRQRS